jgi:hypothetical protein
MTAEICARSLRPSVAMDRRYRNQTNMHLTENISNGGPVSLSNQTG